MTLAAPRFAWLMAIGISAIVSGGCSGEGDDLPREPIAGKVTLDGKPLEHGTIRFEPASMQGTSTVVGAMIDGGSYSVPRAQGPVPGEYLVAINSTSDAPAADEAPGAVKKLIATKDLVPEKYNAKSELKAHVKKGEDNTVNFELTTQ